MTDKHIRLPYGDSYLETVLPDRNVSDVLTSQDIPALEDESEAILNSLRNPIGTEALRDCISKNDKAVVIVTDNTRPCPDDRILPVILSELEGKIPRQNITIIVALGLHPPLTNQELMDKLGKNIFEDYTVINHDPTQTVYIGKTSRGTPVEIHKTVFEADFRISTGFIEPHFFAGFSGGRKSIAPGVSSARSIRKNHSYRMLEHPLSRTGILEGNPVHEDMVEQAEMAKLNFIVNVLLNKNGEITHVVAGDHVKAHEKGCQIEGEIAKVRLDHTADIVLTTNGGAPLDLDFYQTCKGIDTASQITRDGGIIIVASSCHDGIGPREFWGLHATASSPRDVLNKIGHSETHGVSWQNQLLARAQLNHEIFLLSNLEDSIAKEMMVTPIHSIQEGLEKAFKVIGEQANIAIIPEGPLVIPVVTERNF